MGCYFIQSFCVVQFVRKSKHTTVIAIERQRPT